MPALSTWMVKNWIQASPSECGPLDPASILRPRPLTHNAKHELSVPRQLSLWPFFEKFTRHNRGLWYGLQNGSNANWHLEDISWVHWLKTAPGLLLLRLP